MEEEGGEIKGDWVDYSTPIQSLESSKRMKMRIAIEKDITGRNRYLKAKRKAATRSIICNPEKHRQKFQKREELGTLGAIEDTGRLLGGWLFAISNYIRGFAFHILEHFPRDDRSLHGYLDAHPEEFYLAMQIRDLSVNLYRDFGRAFLTQDDNQNYGLLNFATILASVNDAVGAAKELQVERMGADIAE